MFKNILVCLDGSKLAEQILPYAEAQARQFQSKVTLLRVITLSGAGIAGAGYVPHPSEKVVTEQIKLAEKEASDYLAEKAKSLKAQGIEVEAVISQGSPVGNAIIDYADKNAIDLIAIATHGRSGLGRAVFGSVADHVLRETRLPILLVRPKE